ncbi:MAG: DMT family transporter [Candidatus Marinarcus sp.]|uniref:DMT family transporter n=1 Tax=Candidatus Marinarcus sp. TaxID=3100987 RepID=UPI003AFF7F23
MQTIPYKIYSLLILCVLFWSANFILGRFLHEEIEPIQLAFYRWLGVFVLFLPYLMIHFKTLYQKIKKDFLFLLLLSVLCVTGFNTILYFGLQHTQATNALLINSVFPILVIFLASIILKDKITQNQIMGIVLSTLGVVFIVLKGDISKMMTMEFNKGDFYIILSSLDWALYSVLLRYKKLSLNPTEFFATTVTLGFIVLLGIYVFTTQSITEDMNIVYKHYDIIAFIVIFPSILSFFFWNKGILEIGAEKTGQFTHLMPIFGTILAFVFLGENIMFYHFIGLMFIFSGIYLSQFLKKELFKKATR